MTAPLRLRRAETLGGNLSPVGRFEPVSKIRRGTPEEPRGTLTEQGSGTDNKKRNENLTMQGIRTKIKKGTLIDTYA